MKLYFLRHATATDDAPSDEVRALTRAGQREARVAGSALAKLGVKPAVIFSSPLVRARETANLAAKAWPRARKVVVLDQLKNGFSTVRLLQALQPFAQDDEVVLVGHMPSFGKHIAVLLGSGRAEALRLGKGSIACVSLDALHLRAGTLRWLMGQKQLREILNG